MFPYSVSSSFLCSDSAVPTYLPKMEDNIRIGDAETALQDMDSELRVSGATEFVSKLPHGLKTDFNLCSGITGVAGPDAHDILVRKTL